jgi:hypothetical protein
LAAGAEVVVTNITSGMNMLVAAALFRYFDVFESTESALERLARCERPDDDTGPLEAHIKAA